MFKVNQRQHSTVKMIIQKRSLSWLPLAIILWTIDIGFLSNFSWSQESISLPKKEKLAPFPPRSTELAPPTFDNDNPPPLNTPSPQFEQNLDREFDTYRLDVGDSVSVNVPLFPEFSTVGVINEEGNIIMPILGRISLRGLNLTEAEAKIIYELSNRYLQVEPEVIVALAAPRPAQVGILGEVVRPGFYNFVSGSPLNIALSAAGGSTKNADLRSIIIRRSLVDGTLIEREVDLYTPLLNSEALPNVRLQGGDTIIVNKLEIGSDRDYDRALIARSTLPQQTINVKIIAPIVNGGRALRNINLPNGSTFLDAVASLPPGDGILIKEEIAIMRFDREQGKVTTQILNTENALNGDVAEDVTLQDEDVLVVSRTFIGRVLNGFSVLTRPIRDLLGFQRFFDFLFE